MRAHSLARQTPLLLALCCASLALASCSGEGKAKITTPILVPVLEEQLPSLPVQHYIEMTIVLDGDQVYASWAQQRPSEVGHDLWFARATLGQSLVAAAVQVTDNGGDSRQPHLAINSIGDAVIVWVESTSPSRSIQMIEWDESTATFGPMGEIADDSGDNENVRCHFDVLDNLHVVWDRGGEILYRRRPNGGSMSAEAELPQVDAQDAVRPDITSDINGAIFVAWQQLSNLGVSVIGAAISEDNGTDEFPIQGSLLIPIAAGHFQPRVARAAKAGEFFMAYRAGNGGSARIRLARISGGGATTLLNRDVYIGDEDHQALTPVIATIRTGSTTNVYIAWEASGEILARGSFDNGANLGVVRSFSMGHGIEGSALRPEIFAEGETLLAAWDGLDETGGLVRACFLSSSVIGE